MNQVLNDSIVAELRKDLELGIVQVGLKRLTPVNQWLCGKDFECVDLRSQGRKFGLAESQLIRDFRAPFEH